MPGGGDFASFFQLRGQRFVLELVAWGSAQEDGNQSN